MGARSLLMAATLTFALAQLASANESSTLSINDKFQNFIVIKFNINEIDTLNSFDKKFPIIVASAGGDPKIAFTITKKITEEFPEVKILGACLSACAEILARQASLESKLVFLKEPIIGFHHNSLIFSKLASKKQAHLETLCFNDTNRQLISLMKYPENAENITKIQIKKLVFQNDSVILSEDCQGKYDEPKYSFWLPNSVELETIFGLNFSGSVCADSHECLIKNLPMFGSKGQSFVVGNNVYRLVENAGVLTAVVEDWSET